MITPPSERYLAALRHAHYGQVRVRLYDAGVYVADLQPGSVSISIDGQANVQRTSGMQIALDIYDPEDRETIERLTVQQGSITIEHGILFADETTDWVLLATLRIDESSQAASSAGREIHAVDRALLPQEHSLETAQPLNTTYVGLITAFLQQTLPGEPLTIRGTVDETAEPSTGKVSSQGSDRLDEMQRFASAIGGWVINDPDGSFVLSQYEPTIDLPVWEVDADSDGVLVDVNQVWSRREMYNAVGITFTPGDEEDAGYKQKYFFHWDNDPASPTYYDGPFGKRPTFYDEEYDHLPSDDEALEVADRILDEYSGATMSIDLTSVYNPLLLPGDIIRVKFPSGEEEDHVIDVVEHELGGTSRTQIATRLRRRDTIRANIMRTSSGAHYVVVKPEHQPAENDSE